MSRAARPETAPPGTALSQLLAAEANAELRLDEARAAAAVIEAEAARLAGTRLAAVDSELLELARRLEQVLEAERQARLAALAAGGAAGTEALARARGPRRAALVEEVIEAVLVEVA
jgi:hypothetical protein